MISYLSEIDTPKPLELKLFDEADALSNMVMVVEDVELHVHKEVVNFILIVYKYFVGACQ